MKKNELSGIERRERQLEIVIDSRLNNGNYLYFGRDARIIKRHKGELVISTEKGETVVLSRSFEALLLEVMKRAKD